MKKQKTYLIVALLLTLLSIFAVLYKKGSFQKSFDSKKLSFAFAVQNTDDITKVFIADMFENKVLLTKIEGGWMVDMQKPAAWYKINDLLSTLNSIQVAQPVAKAAQQSIIQRLTVNAIKVEVFAKEPLLKVFGHPFFVRERLIKTYFFGDATQTNLGSYALLEGMREPYIIYKPGFRGYVTPIFSADPVDWFSPQIFGTKLTQIKKASFIDFTNPTNTFFVEKSGARTFSLFDSQNNLIKDYDTILLVNMLSEFRERNYEMFLFDISKSQRDSIINQGVFKEISVTDVDNQTTTMKLYHKVEEGALYQDDNVIEALYRHINIDRCYATVNENTDEIFTIQFFHFDRQIQPLSYYLKQ